MYKFLDDKGYLYYISIFKEKYTIYRKINNDISEPRRWDVKDNKLFKNIREAQIFLIESALKNGWKKEKGLM